MQFDAERVHSECWRLGIEVGREYSKGEFGRDVYWIGVHVGHYFFSFTTCLKCDVEDNVETEEERAA